VITTAGVWYVFNNWNKQVEENWVPAMLNSPSMPEGTTDISVVFHIAVPTIAK
jgi:hypothetical protein